MDDDAHGIMDPRAVATRALALLPPLPSISPEQFQQMIRHSKLVEQSPSTFVAVVFNQSDQRLCPDCAQV